MEFARACGPTGGASSSRLTTASRRTSRSSIRPGPAPSSTPTIRTGIQRLNQEAAKAMHAGWQAGMKIDRADAVKWLTLNPARALGIDKVTGSLEPGKNAHVVLWSGDP